MQVYQVQPLLNKCTRCGQEKPRSDFRKKLDGSINKQCTQCVDYVRESLEKNKCDHGKRRTKCRDCGGGSICQHGRQRSGCKECGGGSICQHGRHRRYCKECDGSQICQHDKSRSRCRECGGGSICDHDKIRSQCRDCGGGEICDHDKIRSTCKICDPNGHLAGIVSNAVRKALKSNKSNRSLEYLGTDIETFKMHIEEQFEDWMTWDNYGEWEIDHITPIKYRNPDTNEPPSLEEVIERLHYLNTQPMRASDNMSKGNRRVGK